MKKSQERFNDQMNGRYYTFGRKWRFIGVIGLAATIIGVFVTKALFKPWVHTHLTVCMAVSMAITLLCFSFIVMAKRKKTEDIYYQDILNRTNWFILRFIIFYSITNYIVSAIDGFIMGYPEFLIAVLLAYFFYYEYLKYKHEKLGKAGKSED
jgi:mannose/fructose/N-acetylgalactosamine-specific phosphotransferase system component IID